MQNEFCFFILDLDSSIGFTESSPAYTVEFTIVYKKCVLNYDFNNRCVYCFYHRILGNQLHLGGPGCWKTRNNNI